MSVELLPEDSRVTWILGPAFIVAFLLAFSVGANDVSNSFGTSVGSGVLTVTQACILATIFEVAGSALLGHSVCDFFRQKMYRVDLYQGAEQDLMLGALGCLMGKLQSSEQVSDFRPKIIVLRHNCKLTNSHSQALLCGTYWLQNSRCPSQALIAL